MDSAIQTAKGEEQSIVLPSCICPGKTLLLNGIVMASLLWGNSCLIRILHVQQERINSWYYKPSQTSLVHGGTAPRRDPTCAIFPM